MALAAGLIAAASITLTGCGGGGGSSTDNTALVDELMQQIGDQGMPEGATDCIRTALMGFSTDELETLKNGETDADVPQELQTKVFDMMTGCIGDTN